MRDTEKLTGKIPVEDLQNWRRELEGDLSSDDVGKFFYDHLRRNVIDSLKEGKSPEWVLNIFVSEGEQALKRALTQEEKDDLLKRVKLLKEKIDKGENL